MTAGDLLPDPVRLADLLVVSARRRPADPALLVDDDTVSFGDLLQMSVDRAAVLVDLGIRPGDRVAVLAHNTPEFVASFFAAVLVRAVAAPLHYRYSPRELREVLDIADPACLLMDAGWFADVDTVDALLAAVPAGVPVAAASYRGDRAGVHRTEELVAATGSGAADAVWARYGDADPDDPGTLLFTSGTSARPKGVLHRTGAQARSALSRSRERLGRAPAEVVWTPTPWCHTGGLLAMLGALGHADPVVSSPYFDAARAAEAIDRRRVTTAWLMFPAIVARMAAYADAHGVVWPSVRQAAHIGNDHWFRMTERIFPNARVFTGYGMTESGSLFSLASIGDPRELRQRSCGRPYDGIELGVVDLATGEPAPPGTAGEIVYRGWNLFTEYFRDRAATGAVVDAGGWFHTGDLGTVDETGVLRIQGRAKDVLKVGGENVSPQEVEEVLLEHPAVAMAAVVGVADDALGELPAAFVEFVAGARLGREQLRAHCAATLARFKVPARWFEIPAGEGEWPQSATKIDKRALVRWAAEGARAEIDPIRTGAPAESGVSA